MLHFVNTDKEYPTRLDLGKFVSLNNDIPSILTSWLISKIQQITDFYYFKVTKEVGFSDFVAYSAYKNHAYWWIVKVFNSILEDTEIVEGMVLRIPTESAINKLISELKTKETLYNNGNTTNLDIMK